MSQGLDRFHSRFVYRVLRPDEDPSSDIACSAPLSQRTLCEHVETGLRHPSRFISTSTNLSDALKWMKKANEKSSLRYVNTRNVIVKIDVDLLKSNYPHIAETAYDLSDALNREKYLKKKQQKGYSAAYCEVVFSDIIPAEAVSIEYSKHVRGTEASNAPFKPHQFASNESHIEVPSTSITLRQKANAIPTIKSAGNSKNNNPSKGHITSYKANTNSHSGHPSASIKTAPHIAPMKSYQQTLPVINQTPDQKMSHPTRTLYLSFSPLENLVRIIENFTA